MQDGILFVVTALAVQTDGLLGGKLKRVMGWVAQAEILVAPLVALLLLFPERFPKWIEVGFVVLGVLWLARWIAQRHLWRRTPLDGALLLLLCILPVAVWASAMRALSYVALGYLLSGVLLFKALVQWARTPRRVWWVWAALVAIGGLGLAAVALLGMQLTSDRLFPLPSFLTRWAGRFPEVINANVMAGAPVLLWPLALAGLQFRFVPWPGDQAPSAKWPGLLARTAPHGLRLLAAAAALLTLLTVLLTQSRGGYLGAAAAGLVFVALRWPRAARLLLPLALVGGLVGMSLIGWGTIADELMTGEATSGLDQRVEIWSRALYATQDFPFTGLGLGTFERVVAILYPLFLNPDGTVPHAHNLYLQVAVDVGLPGLVAYLAILGLSFAGAFFGYRVFRRVGQPALAALCAGCIAGLTGMCVHGLVDAVVWGTKMAFVPWLVMGFAMALHNLAYDISAQAAHQEHDTARADCRVEKLVEETVR
jgi:putative inorganic carbon (hco3(-)) transporter